MQWHEFQNCRSLECQERLLWWFYKRDPDTLAEFQYQLWALKPEAYLLVETKSYLRNEKEYSPPSHPPYVVASIFYSRYSLCEEAHSKEVIERTYELARGSPREHCLQQGKWDPTLWEFHTPLRLHVHGEEVYRREFPAWQTEAVLISVGMLWEMGVGSFVGILRTPGETKAKVFGRASRFLSWLPLSEMRRDAQEELRNTFGYLWRRV